MTSSERKPDVQMRLSSDPRYVGVVRHMIESMAQTLDLDEQSCAELGLAITEALSNVIRHGYKGRTDGAIWIKAAPVAKDGRPGLEVVIEDECAGVDLNRIKSRPLEEVRPGGLGVHIIQRIMDEVEYGHREAGRGLRLRIRKYANGAISPASKEAAL